MNNTIVEIRNVIRRFGRKTALDDVSLTIPEGIVFGLVGENGAGKTTLIKHILGLLKAQEGHVRVFNLNPAITPTEVLGRIGYMSEDRDLPDWMRVGELMRYTRAFYPKWDESYAGQLCESFALDRRQKIKTLSKGQLARIGLLVALAHRPDLLVLDEPSSGLDPVVRRDILDAAILTVKREGRTVLFSSHLLEEVERTAEMVGMMHGGKVALHARLDEIKSSHCRVSVRFDQPVEEAPDLPGALSSSGHGRDWVYICGAETEPLRQAVSALNASVVEQATPSLDEIFVSRVRNRSLSK